MVYVLSLQPFSCPWHFCLWEASFQDILLGHPHSQKPLKTILTLQRQLSSNTANETRTPFTNHKIMLLRAFFMSPLLTAFRLYWETLLHGVSAFAPQGQGNSIRFTSQWTDADISSFELKPHFLILCKDSPPEVSFKSRLWSHKLCRISVISAHRSLGQGEHSLKPDWATQ